MNLISKITITKISYFSLLLAFIPVSFIAGNMIININIILIIVSALFVFKKLLFKINYSLLDKLIILFFVLVLVTGIFNDIQIHIKDREFSDWRGGYGTIIKSIFFFKYLLLYFTLRYLIENKIINFKIFFLSCSLSSLFVCLDIFFQFFYGKDIFGYEIIYGRKLSGPFGDELIAGGYIQRFSLFAFFLIPIFYNSISTRMLKCIISVLTVIFLFGLILSGNRMPLILFVFALSLIMLFQKQTRKFLFPFIIIFSLFYFLIFNLSPQVKNNFNNFYNQISMMINIVIEKDYNNKNSPQYMKEFSTFYETWLLNKYIGGGIKNFRYYCHVRQNIDKNSKFICNMHPHNYYLEILTETGVVGFGILIIIFLLILYNSLYKKYFTLSHLKYNNLIIPFIFLFFVEIFPVKSTGSFFTTGNATYFFLIMTILVSLSQNHNSFENKK